MFANYRRNGYDFDSLYEDELANYRSKKIMDLFPGEEELFSFEVDVELMEDTTTAATTIQGNG